jgi:hypothetical protein
MFHCAPQLRQLIDCVASISSITFLKAINHGTSISHEKYIAMGNHLLYNFREKGESEWPAPSSSHKRTPR